MGLNQQINALQEEKATLIQQMQTMRDEMENKIKQTAEEIDATHKEALEQKCAQIAQLEEHSGKLEVDLANFTKNNEKLIASKDKQIDRWKNKYAQTDEELKKLEAIKAKLYSDCQSATNELKCAQENLTRTHSDLEVAERDLGIVEHEKLKLQTELDSVAEAFEKSESEMEKCKQSYDELEALLEKTNADHAMALLEADEELGRELKTSSELYTEIENFEEEIKKLKVMNIEQTETHKKELSALERELKTNIAYQIEDEYECKLREEKDEKKKMEEEIQSLHEQLESLKLRCSNAPSPNGNNVKRDSMSSIGSNSSYNGRGHKKRKRPRDEMEIESVEEIQPINANPSKKRKITLLDEPNPLSNSTLATDTQSSSDLNSSSKSP